ncbi:MAG TPA: sialidase family protein [Candidatus Eisenbacteria bacterium]
MTRPSATLLAACAALACASPARARKLDPLLGTVDTLSSPAAPGSGEPHLSRSREGQVWMSWIEPRAGGGNALEVARLTDQTWGAPLTVAAGDSFIVNWADRPSVVALGGGRLAAHWLVKAGPGPESSRILMAFSNDEGRTWGKPTRPHRDSDPVQHGFVSMIPEMDGVRAIWLDGRNFVNWVPPKDPDSEEEAHKPGPDMTMRTALVHADGSLTDEFELDGRVCDCCPTAAVLLTHGLLIAYRDRGPEEERDIALIQRMDAKWSGSYPLHADGWKIAGCPVNGPALDAAPENVAAAWYTEAGDTIRVLAAISDDLGGSFGAPVRVDEGSAIGRVDVSLLEDGSALVLWLETKGSRAQILARRVARDGSRSPPVKIADTDPWRTSGVPRMLREGKRMIFVWTEAGYPSHLRVAAARLGAR